MGDILQYTLLATIADIDFIGSISYGSNMCDMLHSLARMSAIDLIGSIIMCLIWVTCCIL